jgi:hypothetical protein
MTLPEETFAPVGLPSEESSSGFAAVPLPQ